MKYIFKKKLKARYNTWSIGDYIEFCNPETDIEICDYLNISIAELIKQGFVEEVKETPNPRWKVGDKIVIEVEGCDNRYGIIEGIVGTNYRSCGGENWMEDKFRHPTQEELSLYFR